MLKNKCKLGIIDIVLRPDNILNFLNQYDKKRKHDIDINFGIKKNINVDVETNKWYYNVQKNKKQKMLSTTKTKNIKIFETE